MTGRWLTDLQSMKSESVYVEWDGMRNRGQVWEGLCDSTWEEKKKEWSQVKELRTKMKGEWKMKRRRQATTQQQNKVRWKGTISYVFISLGYDGRETLFFPQANVSCLFPIQTWRKDERLKEWDNSPLSDSSGAIHSTLFMSFFPFHSVVAFLNASQHSRGKEKRIMWMSIDRENGRDPPWLERKKEEGKRVGVFIQLDERKSL